MERKNVSRFAVRAVWKNETTVEYYMAGGDWAVSGRFTMCLRSMWRSCRERLQLIIRAPVEPPRRLYKAADVVLDHLRAMVGEAELRHYAAEVGVTVDSVAEFPDFYIRAELKYDVYDCLKSAACLGWYAVAEARHILMGGEHMVKWMGYMAPSLDDVRMDVLRRALHTAIRHAYNAKYFKKSAP